MSYPTPEIGARHMYETVREHLKNLLGQTGGETSEMEKEHAQHEAFLITRLGMGGRLVGGDRYLGEIDSHVLGEELEDDDGEVLQSKHMLLLGDAGKKWCLEIIETIYICAMEIHYGDFCRKNNTLDFLWAGGAF